MARGNKTPIITPEFRAHILSRDDDTTEPLAKEAVRVRLTERVNAAVRTTPSMSAWLRRVITEAAERELMKDGEI
jgi:hypothetical protein